MDFKDTLLLPKTDFPMRGNLPQNEPKKYQAWFDADTLTAFPWLDKSGNGCRGNAVNAMTVNNAWANGHKSAVFSGASSNPPYVQTNVPVTSGVKTLFAVYDISSATNGSSKREQTVISEGDAGFSDFLGNLRLQMFKN